MAPRLGRLAMTTTATPSDVRNPIILVASSCDRCGARATVRAELQGGGELLFCGHHGREHGEALWREGAEIYEDNTPGDRRART
jgi:hypothetical protein